MVDFFHECIPITPIPLERARRAADGHWYTPPASAKFKKNFGRILSALMRGKPPMEGPLYVSVCFVVPKPKTATRKYPCVKPDLDNYIKAIDAATGIIWVDDAQIVRLSAQKEYPTPDSPYLQPCIDIQVGEV